MPHDISLISTLAVGFALALFLGFVAERLRLSALIGYLLAGVAIGPATPGFVADMAIAGQLAEIGVMLLMFGVGLHFSVADLLAVKRIALPGALVQMSVATALGALVAHYWGWSWGEGLVFGLCLSCASTVVLLRALEARGILDTGNGRIAVGWLVVEDLATVLVLVLLPPLAAWLRGGSDGMAADVTSASTSPASPLWQTILWTLVQVGAFITLMLVAGRRVLPWLLWQVARTGSRELFTLAVIAAAVSIAFGVAKVFGVSFALGAFFAGMVMRESPFSHRAAQESLPLREAFAVLFFVSVGMLFEPAVLMQHPWLVVGTLLIILVGKSLAASLLVLAFRHSLETAFTVAASLAQVGEFSFILAGLALSLGLISPLAQNLVLAGAILSIALNPLLFAAVKPCHGWFLRHSRLARERHTQADPLQTLPDHTAGRYLAGQVVVVGEGAVAAGLTSALAARGIPLVVVDGRRDRVEALRQQGLAAVCGDAAEPMTLVQAHIARAAVLMLAAPEATGQGPVLDTARALNPELEILVFAADGDAADLLQKHGASRVFRGEDELVRAMVAHVTPRYPETVAG